MGLTTRHRLPAGLWVSASLHCSPSSALQTCSKPLDSSSLSSPRLGQSLRCWALGALMGPVQRIFHCLPSHSQVWAREPEAQPTTGFQAKRGGKRQVPATGARLNCDRRYCQTLGPALAPKGARRSRHFRPCAHASSAGLHSPEVPGLSSRPNSFFSLGACFVAGALSCSPERLPPVLAPRICFPSCFVAHTFQIYWNPKTAPSDGKLLAPEGSWEW